MLGAAPGGDQLSEEFGIGHGQPIDLTKLADVAGVFVFLASDDGAFMTAATQAQARGGYRTWADHRRHGTIS
jgi:hypothetical protein